MTGSFFSLFMYHRLSMWWSVGGIFFLVLYIYEHQPIAITLFHGLNLIFRWFCDTIFICPKTKNSLKLTTVHNTFQTWIRNTSNLICLMLCSITSITMIEWRHYSSNFLNAVTKKKIPKVPQKEWTNISY